MKTTRKTTLYALILIAAAEIAFCVHLLSVYLTDFSRLVAGLNLQLPTHATQVFALGSLFDAFPWYAEALYAAIGVAVVVSVQRAHRSQDASKVWKAFVAVQMMITGVALFVLYGVLATIHTGLGMPS